MNLYISSNRCTVQGGVNCLDNGRFWMREFQLNEGVTQYGAHWYHVRCLIHGFL